MIIEAERTFDCCGAGIKAGNSSVHPNMEDHEWSIEHMVFTEGVHKCFSAVTDIPKDCYTCYVTLHSMVTSANYHLCVPYLNFSLKVQSGFNTAGGLGLFFSIPEVVLLTNNHEPFCYFQLLGALMACRYRNMMDPFAHTDLSK